MLNRKRLLEGAGVVALLGLATAYSVCRENPPLETPPPDSYAIIYESDMNGDGLWDCEVSRYENGRIVNPNKPDKYFGINGRTGEEIYLLEKGFSLEEILMARLDN